MRFCSQPNFSYNWSSHISEGGADLELAYALTVHKSQGSGFKATIFILNEPENGVSPFLSRELLYTALTRQSDKIFVLYNKEPSDLKKYAAAGCSELARRMTNLFLDPVVVHEYKGGWYDATLLHKTKRGGLVRSKSEVIIANELAHADIVYEYEKPLDLEGGPCLPDFTITLRNDKKLYWEHLGMLEDEAYRNKWTQKEARYAQNDISESKGNLIVTQDVNGTIDASEKGPIQLAIKKIRKQM